jgi:hypothetical protein
MTTRAAILRDMTFSFASLLPSAHQSRGIRTMQQGKDDACARRRTHLIV